MTDEPLDFDIKSPTEFRDALGDLLLSAARNGIDPRGSWVYTNTDSSTPNWETMVYEINTTDNTDD